MKNKRNIMILLLLIFSVVVNIKLVIDKNKISDKIEALKSENVNNQVETSTENTAYLRGLGHVKLYYSTDDQPSFGYKADVNTSVQSDDNKVEIIEDNGEWAKISISGWIPKWYLTNDYPKENEIRHIYPNQKRTVKEDCHLSFIPEENDKVINPEIIKSDYSGLKLKRGQVVELIYEYDEWYYVKRFILWDANDYTEGWVKKSYLVTFEELQPSEVMIKKGTKIYDSNNELITLDENVYGRIRNEKDGWYEITLPGASLLRVKKEDITYE